MGADYIGGMLPKADMTDARKEVMRQTISQLTQADVAIFLAEFGFDDAFGRHSDSRASLSEAIDEYASWNDDVRGVGTTFLGVCYWFMSGGLTWGDDATEEMDTINKIASCVPVFDLLRTWAVQDAIDLIPERPWIKRCFEKQLDAASAGLVKHRRTRSKPVTVVMVTDPDTGLEVEVEIRKLANTGAMLGIDGSYLERDDAVYDPYTLCTVVDVPDDEYGT